MIYFNGSDGPFLKHHGVKGMRWGIRKQRQTLFRKIRRFRNKQKTKQIRERIEKKHTSSSINPDIKSMNDADLLKAINRMNNEKRYLDLQKDLHKYYNPRKVTPIRDAIGRVSSSVLEDTAKEMGKAILKDILTTQYNKSKAKKKKHSVVGFKA